MKDKNVPSQLIRSSNSGTACTRLLCLSALSALSSDQLVSSTLHIGGRHFALQPLNLQT